MLSAVRNVNFRSSYPSKVNFGASAPLLPSFEVINPEKWARYLADNQDFYGGAIISYAAHWASKMETAMKGGKTVAEVAESAARELPESFRGLNADMAHFSAQTLVDVWKHGQALKDWYNARF